MDELHKKPALEVMPQKGLGKPVKLSTNRKFLITIGVALALIASVWIWKSAQIGNIKKDAATDRQNLKEQASRQIVQTHQEHLKLLAKPLVWAVRSEMMQGSLNQVNLFANDMVKEKNFQRIVIANDKGIIISSTNKKDEGKELITVGKQVYLSSNTTIVESINDSIVVMSSPIMGVNNRLGTFVIHYKVVKPVFD